MAFSFAYANPASGPSAGGIGWFDFGAGFTIAPNQVITNISATLNNGVKVTFDMTLTTLSGSPTPITATVPNGVAYFGIPAGGYTGLTTNHVVLLSDVAAGGADMSIILSNIIVQDANNNLVPNYTLIVADGQSTTANPIPESITVISNGGNFAQLAQLGNTNVPILTLSGQTATILGSAPPLNADFVLTTDSPTMFTANLSWPVSTARQAIAIGFATTQIHLKKNLTGRVDPADQFQLDITGTPSDTATTTGAATGIQAEFAEIFAIPGNAYGINESMAPGSVSSSYTYTVSAVNTTPSGSVPPVGNLPISFTPALGDDVTYTILNTADVIITKTVDKAFSNVGDILTYTIQVYNPNNFVVNNVLITDSTPAGTTYIGNLSSTNTFIGTDINTGITFPIIPVNTIVSISWQVQVDNVLPLINPILNTGSVSIDGGAPGNTNTVSTQVNTAIINTTKTVDKQFANVGDIITYTITVANSGNVTANNVVLTDALPAGLTFVPGSLTNATGTPPTLTLSSPVIAGGSVVVTFKALVNFIPNPNPILNSAVADFTYTVDPLNQNNASGTSYSNVATTKINTAKIVMTKSTNKAISYIGDTITYQISMTNTGNVPANNVVITDLLNTGLAYVPGSLVVNVPSIGNPMGSISLTNPIAAGQTVTLSFKATVTNIPNPNPALNKATADYSYTVDPGNTNGVSTTSQTNTVSTTVFRNNFSQQISDLIESVALEQAALAALANAEGSKIQRMAAIPGVTPQQLLCLNKSVTEMTNSIALLELVIKQKLAVVDCQIDGGTC